MSWDSTNSWASSAIPGPRRDARKIIGKPCAGKPHARIERGTGKRALTGTAPLTTNGDDRPYGQRSLPGRQAGGARAGRRSRPATKNAALEAIADALIDRTDEIIEANALDLEAGQPGRPDAGADRPPDARSRARIAGIADGVRQIAALADPVGEVLEGFRRPNGLDIRRVRVPLGVIAVVYEARPNVTIDAAALCLKSGNAIVLRGSSTAAPLERDPRLAGRRCGRPRAGVPEAAISLVAGGGRAELAELASQNGLVDLIIPRGGRG